MNRIQLESLTSNRVIEIGDLQDKSDRTLLWGYTCDRASFHVYIKDKEIKTVIYFSGNKIEEIHVDYNREYIPDKRLYPEACDFEFCSLLKMHGENLPFTIFDDNRTKYQYYGEVI